MIGIYKITNNITGKVYIGQSGAVEHRWGNHKRTATSPNYKQYNDELYCDMREYGIDNFTFEILEEIDITDREEYWIQKYKNENIDMYNKDFKPHSNPGEKFKIFNEEQIDQIINLLSSKKYSNITISKMFNCSSSTIDNINLGKTYRRDNISYPINESFELRKRGTMNHNCLYTYDEVLELRKLYVNHTVRDIYENYKELIKDAKYETVEKMIQGSTYKDVPVYSKRKKQWFLDNKPYRLEP